MVVGLGESTASIHKYWTSVADQRRVKTALRTVKTYDVLDPLAHVAPIAHRVHLGCGMLDSF
jgi:hypothetical protein